MFSRKAIFFTILVTAQSLLCCYSASSTSLYKGPIIDMHVHAYNELNSQFGESFNPVTQERRLGATSLDEHQSQTFAMFERLNIVKAVVSTPDTSTAAARAWQQQQPDIVLIGQSMIDPDSLDLAAMKEARIQGKLDVLAEVMPIYAGVEAGDERIGKVFAAASELAIPLGYHLFPGGPPGSAYFASPHLRAGLAKPLQLEEHLLSYPKVNVYIMHGGWPFLNDMKALMYAHPQVYIDVAVICWYLPLQEFHHYLKSLVDAGFGKRIMFGSDQMTWPEEIQRGVDAINTADFLTIEQKADIFYNNAVRFLGL